MFLSSFSFFFLCIFFYSTTLVYVLNDENSFEMNNWNSITATIVLVFEDSLVFIIVVVVLALFINFKVVAVRV